jgi:hypothetical protein
VSKSAEYSLDRLITLDDRAAEVIAQSDVGLLRPTRFERKPFGDISGFFHLFMQPPDGGVRIFEIGLKGALRTFAFLSTPARRNVGENLGEAKDTGAVGVHTRA